MRVGEGEVADDPVIAQRVVDDDRISLVVGVARRVGAAEEGIECEGGRGRPVALVEDPDRCVHRLDVVALADIAVGVGRPPGAEIREIEAREVRRGARSRGSATRRLDRLVDGSRRGRDRRILELAVVALDPLENGAGDRANVTDELCRRDPHGAGRRIGCGGLILGARLSGVDGRYAKQQCRDDQQDRCGSRLSDHRDASCFSRPAAATCSAMNSPGPARPIVQRKPAAIRRRDRQSIRAEAPREKAAAFALVQVSTGHDTIRVLIVTWAGKPTANAPRAGPHLRPQAA